MNEFQLLLKVGPQLIPLIPRLEKAITTMQRITADPSVRDAIAVAKEIAQIVANAEKSA